MELKRLARAAHKIAQHRNVRSVSADTPGINRQAETFGQIQIHTRVIEFRETETGGRLHSVSSSGINRPRRPMALPGTAREFVKLLPIAFVPSVHRGFLRPLRCGQVPFSFRRPSAALLRVQVLTYTNSGANSTSYSLPAGAREGISSPTVSNTSTGEMFRARFVSERSAETKSPRGKGPR
jgi:hypothetical protein